eukprot:Sdes_comp20887_c0_seq2m17982
MFVCFQDVGWLKTVDEYYLGANNSIQHAGVRYILDSVISALLVDPARKFMYVEIAFFRRWWQQQSESMKKKVRKLVQEGRFEFVSGGISMNDEACVYYRDAITNMEAGFEFLLQEFDVRPRTAWQIDPFGHSSTQAMIFSRLGFEAFFMTRIDYQDKDLRIRQKNLQFLWKFSNNPNDKIWTHVMHDHYCTPDRFSFDFNAGNTPVNDDRAIFGYNVDLIAADLASYLRKQADAYQHPHLLFPFGCDFTFENAHVNFANMDRLIKHINADPQRYRMNLFYSTPASYSTAIQSTVPAQNWAHKSDDFFPYCDAPHACWTGFFTSRPALKKQTRATSAMLHVASLFSAALRLHAAPPHLEALAASTLRDAREVVGIAQHHDAVSGTSKQVVAFDYSQRLSTAFDQLNRLLEAHLPWFLAASSPPFAPIHTCTRLNESICEPTQKLAAGETLQLTLINPLSQNRSWLVRVPVSVSLVQVRDADGFFVPSQVNDLRLLSFPLYSHSSRLGEAVSDFELLFFANLSPTEISAFQISALSSPLDCVQCATVVSPENSADSFVLRKNSSHSATSPQNPQNDHFHEFRPQETPHDDLPARLRSFTKNLFFAPHEPHFERHYVRRNYFYYESMGPLNHSSFRPNPPPMMDLTMEADQPSGAYIFRPSANGSQPVLEPGMHPETSLFRGPIVSDMYFNFVPTNLSTTCGVLQDRITVSEQMRHAIVSTTIGDIRTLDGIGKEFVIRYESDLYTKATFFTDSMGQMNFAERTRDARPTWQLNLSEPISQNFYPVNSVILIRDLVDHITLGILNDRSQAGSSLQSGQIELMLHRRTEYDDYRGVAEPLSEKGSDGTGLVITADQWILFEDSDEFPALMNPLLLEMNHPVFMYFSPLAAASSPPRGSARRRLLGAGELPAGVHLLSFQPFSGSFEGADFAGSLVFLVRLQNMLGWTRDEEEVGVRLEKDANCVVVSLVSFLRPFSIQSIIEMELGGTRAAHVGPILRDEILLEPLEVRTFLVRIAGK